jgi:hypothetical protein
MSVTVVLTTYPRCCRLLGTRRRRVGRDRVRATFHGNPPIFGRASVIGSGTAGASRPAWRPSPLVSPGRRDDDIGAAAHHRPVCAGRRGGDGGALRLAATHLHLKAQRATGFGMVSTDSQLSTAIGAAVDFSPRSPPPVCQSVTFPSLLT